MISRPQTTDLLGSPVSSPAPTDSTAHGQMLDAAYQEYHRRRSRGETVNAVEFCERFPSVRASLARLIQAEEFLDANPELLDDAPRNWPEVGAVWEGFQLLAELGAGAFARVYLARELALGGRLVAIKCTSLGAQEAATLGRLDHPGVVPIHSIRDLPDANLTVVCMPYLGYATLQHVCTKLQARPQPNLRAAELLEACRDPRLPEGAAPELLRRGAYLDGVRWIAARVAGALAYLHGQGICHRDLKPSNILVQPDGTPRLLDFNLSADALLPQTRLGGTLHYMAPEQLAALEHCDAAVLTPQVDVFALGVILHEWLLGVHPCAPLPANADAAILRRRLLDRYQDGSRRGAAPAGVAPSLVRVIQRCLHVSPEQRPTAAQVEQELLRQLRPERRLGRALGRHPLRTLTMVAGLGLVLALGLMHAANQPSQSQAAFAQGWQAYRTGDYAGAIDQFNLAAARGADPVDCSYARARAYQRRGEHSSDPKTSREYFNQALTEFRNAYQRDSRGKFMAGIAYCAHRSQQIPLATEEYYETALKLGFDSPIVYHNLGCVQLDLGPDRIQSARANFEKALALDEKSSLTHFQLADALLRLYEQDVQGKPLHQGGPMPELVRLAMQHLQSGLPDRKTVSARQAEQAARSFAKAIPFDPDAVDQALSWLETAVAAGSNPTALGQDVSFRALWTHSRYAALLQWTSQSRRNAIPFVRILDPLTDEVPFPPP